MKRALITGIAGFAGSHLAEHLLENGWEVTGVYHHHAPLKNLDHLRGDVTLESCDILKRDELGPAIERFKPEVVFHLAAVSFVPSADNAPHTAFDANVTGSLNVFDESSKRVPAARVIFISSAEVYGKVSPGEVPLGEKSPLRPANIYALTKRCGEEIASYYGRSFPLEAIILRPFNHIGPRQNPHFVTSSFAKQIAEIEAGKKPPVIEVGNLEAARDFTDVRDIASGYRLAAESCEPGIPYNICSGRAYVIRDILEKLLGMSTAEVEVRQDPSRLRKSDVPVMQGDHSLFSRATGWQPRYDIDTTLRDLLDYWRAETAGR